MMRLAGAVLWAVLSAATAWAEGGTPRFDAVETSHDLGIMLFDEPLSHTFHFNNTGSAPLAVAVTQRSCGCTSDLLDAAVVPPGETGRLAVGYVPGGDDPRKGSQSFSLVLETNDPRQREVPFTIRADLVEEVAVRPELLTLSPASGDATAVLDVYCMRRDGREPPSIVAVDITSADIQVLEEETVADGAKTRIRYAVGVSGPVSASLEQAVITVRTTSAARPLVEVPVAVRQVQPYRLEPPTAAFGAIPAGETRERQLVLRQEGTAAAAPHRVSSPHALVSATLAPGEASSWLLTIRVTSPEGSPQHLKTRVEVMDDAGNLLASVPVLALAGK